MNRDIFICHKDMQFIYYSLSFKKGNITFLVSVLLLQIKKKVVKAILEYPGNLTSLMRKLPNMGTHTERIFQCKFSEVYRVGNTLIKNYFSKLNFKTSI